jgi:hypothetical protein
MITIEITRVPSTNLDTKLLCMVALLQYCHDSYCGDAMLNMINEVIGNASLTQILASCCDRQATDKRDMV